MEQKLQDYCESIVDSEHKTAPTQEFGIPYIRTPDIEKGRLNLKSAKKVSEEIYKEWTKRLEPKSGDLILTREAPVGEVGIIPKNCKVCLGQRTVLIRPNNSKLDSVYLLYLFQTKSFLHLLTSKSGGTIVVHLNMKEIRDLEISDLPEIDIQRKIGSVLSNFDSQISILEKQNHILEKIIQSIFKSWFVDFDGQAEFVDSELGEIPKGWKVEKIEEFCNTFGGGTPSTTNADYWNGDINWAIPSDLTKAPQLFLESTERKITSEGLKNCASKLHPPNSILMTSRATIGFFSINTNPIATNQGFIVIEPKYSNQLYYLLNNFKFRVNEFINYASGTTFLEISRGTFRNMLVLVPPSEILESFHKIIHPFHENILKNERTIIYLISIRDSLLPKLMSGEIRV